MSLFIDRKPRSRRFLVWKTRIFAVAAVIALVGMYLNNPFVTGAALVLLLVGVALIWRLVAHGSPVQPEDNSGGDSGHFLTSAGPARKLAEQRGVFVRRPPGSRLEPPVRLQLARAVEQPKRDVGVADVDGEQQRGLVRHGR